MLQNTVLVTLRSSLISLLSLFFDSSNNVAAAAHRWQNRMAFISFEDVYDCHTEMGFCETEG
jgi:hypothetical protein